MREFTQILAERHDRFRKARSHFRRSCRRDVAVQLKELVFFLRREDDTEAHPSAGYGAPSSKAIRPSPLSKPLGRRPAPAEAAEWSRANADRPGRRRAPYVPVRTVPKSW